MFVAISIDHWFHAMHMHVARSYYLPEASTPAIDISDRWGETPVLGSWSLPLNELTRSSLFSVAGSFLNIMDRVEYEVYENDMDLTQDDTEASKEKVNSMKLIIK